MQDESCGLKKSIKVNFRNDDISHKHIFQSLFFFSPTFFLKIPLVLIVKLMMRWRPYHFIYKCALRLFMWAMHYCCSLPFVGSQNFSQAGHFAKLLNVTFDHSTSNLWGKIGSFLVLSFNSVDCRIPLQCFVTKWCCIFYFYKNSIKII